MLHESFEKAARLNSNKTALSFQNEIMTYEQLNIKSNQLAHKLIERGVVCGTKVAILMERSFDMVVSIIAILKAGGAYVPIDTEYPEALIEHIIKDSESKVIITNSERFHNSISVNDLEQFNKNNPNVPLQEDALAYIIYTSGSTGYPKGVMIEHRNAESLLNSASMKFTSSDIWTLFHSISFDFSVWELFESLLTGATLVIVPNEIRRNFRKFRSLLIENNVTVLNQTTSSFYSLQEEEFKYPEKQLTLRYVIFGGEKLNPKLMSKWKNKYQNTSLIHVYGITETTIFSTYKEMDEEDVLSNISNIGKAFSNSVIHLLNDKFEPVLLGEVGEIYVEGAGLAKGYTNNSALTSEKFFIIPTVSENRLYRSGDLGRYLYNGDLEYVGRADNQVKVRGHRIELDQIEAQLNKYDAIKQSIVIVTDANETDKLLQAFYTSESDIDPKDISDFLATTLPTYMIPISFKRVEKFKQTNNGKIDRKCVLQYLDAKKDGALMQPSISDELNEIQKQALEVITACFSEKNIRDISIYDDFTAIGIDSLTFIKIVVALETKFDFVFDDEKLLISKFPTTKAMLEYVELKAMHIHAK